MSPDIGGASVAPTTEAPAAGDSSPATPPTLPAGTGRHQTPAAAARVRSASATPTLVGSGPQVFEGRPLAFRPDELPPLLGMGRTKVNKLLRDGELPCRRIGRARVILASELAAWLDELPR